MDQKLISIGLIRTAFGLKGWLKIASHSNEWDHFFKLKTIALQHPKSKNTSKHAVEQFYVQVNTGMLKLCDINVREQAKAYAGHDILVPEGLGAPLKTDEWYLSDLVGLRVLDDVGQKIGVVQSVLEVADDLLEICKPDGKTFLVPFRKHFVSQPDLADGSIILYETWFAS